jgi:hypothetical protein
MKELLIPSPEMLGPIEPDDIPVIQSFFTERAQEIEKEIQEILFPRDKIDPRVLNLENALNELNKKRAASYGREYIPPKVLYINALLFAQLKEIAEKSSLIQEIEGLFSSGAAYLSLENIIFIHYYTFENPEVNALFTSYLLRHEMGHAGSVIKLMASEPEPGVLLTERYRVGSFLNSPKKGELGEGLLEGHNTVEDAQGMGEFQEKAWRSQWLSESVFNLGDSYKAAISYRENIRQQLIEEGKLRPEQPLTGYWEIQSQEGKMFEFFSSGETYSGYVDLMAEIYDREPLLYSLAEDFIYGDKMIAFAKKADEVFGKGFFRELMLVNSDEKAKILLKKITQKKLV